MPTESPIADRRPPTADRRPPTVDRIGVHESVGAVFPPEKLVEALSDLDADVTVVADGARDLRACEAVVTVEHRDAFLGSVPWVHSIQSGVDRFPLDAFAAAGVALTNSTGIHGESVGEMVVAYMVSLARNLHGYVASNATASGTAPRRLGTWSARRSWTRCARTRT